jgi:outer membrane autotransporter protein
VGTVTLASGATIAPGNSAGTFTIAGDLILAAGSTYEVEVNPEGSDGDLLHVTGVAHLNGASVAHVGTDGNYKPFSTYTILTADGGIDGTFSGVTSDFAFLDPTLSYDPNNVYLQLARNDIAFCLAGMTSNQCATGTGVESIGPGTPIYDAVVLLSAQQAAHAFNQLSGEAHASLKGMLIEDSHFVRDAAIDRLRSLFASLGSVPLPVLAYGEDGLGRMMASQESTGLAAWGRGFGAWSNLEGDGNAASFSWRTGGFLAGLDAAFGGHWRAGFLTGYSHSSFDVDPRASSGSADSWHVGVYGGGQWGALGLRMGAAYSWHDVETERTVVIPGFTDSLTASYDAASAQVFGEIAYGFTAGALAFEPFASLAYVHLHSDGFTEEGGAAALTSPSASTDVTFTTLGVRAATAFRLGSVTARARGMVGWQHAFGDTTPRSRFAFAGSDPFTIAGTPIAEDALLVEAGIGLDLNRGVSLGLTYTGQIADGASSHGAKADLTLRF